ncbi:hypothetical protein [Microcystis phage Mel-JY01]
MPNRYLYSHIYENGKKIESDGTEKTVRRLTSIIYPEFSTPDDTKYVTQEGDRLDLIAKEFYGDESFWFTIARANGLGKGSLAVPPGIILRVPFYQDYTGISAILQEYNRIR